MKVLFLAVLISLGLGSEWVDGRFVSADVDRRDAKNAEPDSCVPFSFRWLETENVRYTSKIRHVEVFMDPKAFNEENMKKLFSYLSSTNTDTESLTVILHTDWAQMQPPAPNCPGTGISEQPADPHEYDYLQAIFWRRGKREYFSYSPRIHVDASEFKDVSIR
jgi:hypothetical protein